MYLTRIRTSRKLSVGCTARTAACSSPPAKVNNLRSNMRTTRSDSDSSCLFITVKYRRGSLTHKYCRFIYFVRHQSCSRWTEAWIENTKSCVVFFTMLFCCPDARCRPEHPLVRHHQGALSLTADGEGSRRGLECSGRLLHPRRTKRALLQLVRLQ